MTGRWKWLVLAVVILLIVVFWPAPVQLPELEQEPHAVARPGGVEAASRSDCPEQDVLEARRAALREQLDIARLDLEVERAHQIEREGAPVGWDNVETAHRPAAVERRLQDAMASVLPEGSRLLNLDCEEFPCITTYLAPWEDLTVDQQVERNKELYEVLTGGSETRSYRWSRITERDGQRYALDSFVSWPQHRDDENLNKRVRHRGGLEFGDATLSLEDEQ